MLNDASMLRLPHVLKHGRRFLKRIQRHGRTRARAFLNNPKNSTLCSILSLLQDSAKPTALDADDFDFDCMSFLSDDANRFAISGLELARSGFGSDKYQRLDF
ncbi:MAG: hypothetical protein HY299_04110 [Verrucomicrobia bacterium]|nr:hypothetical protein [Verrucomicrobiota bacterium]